MHKNNELVRFSFAYAYAYVDPGFNLLNAFIFIF